MMEINNCHSHLVCLLFTLWPFLCLVTFLMFFITCIKEEWSNFIYFLSDVVLTSKHHEGWCNFPNSYHWNWNSVDVGPKRDLVGDLTNSVRAAGIHMGLYHSLREWFNPLYMEDNQPSCSKNHTTLFPDEVLLPTLKEMVMQYKVGLHKHSCRCPCALYVDYLFCYASSLLA